MPGWLLGAGINLVGSILINLGTNIMKLGHNKRAACELPEEQKPKIRTIREWQLGFGMFLVGNVANFTSLAYAAQSLLAALGCIQFVSNVFFASFVLKEQITSGVLISTACIIGGCVLLIAFGNHSSSQYDVAQLTALYGKGGYVAYMVVGSVTVVGAYLLYSRGLKLIREKGADAHPGWVRLLPVTYALFAALIGTQSVLFSKTLSVLLRVSANGDNQFGHWFTWFVIPMFLLCSIFWVTRLNQGLQQFPAMVIVPTMQIAWTLFSILSGFLYFQEYKGFSGLGATMFCIGVLVVFFGVFLLTKAQRQQPRAAGVSEEELETTRFMAKQQNSSYDDGVRDEARIGATPEPCTEHVSVTPLGDAALQPAGDLRSPQSPTRRARFEDDVPVPEREGSEALLMQRSQSQGIKHQLNSLRLRMGLDFGLDESAAARLTGLGDSSMPALSIFGPPAIDFCTLRASATTPTLFSPHAAAPQRQDINPLSNAISITPQTPRDKDFMPNSPKMAALKQHMGNAKEKLKSFTKAPAQLLKSSPQSGYVHLNGDGGDGEYGGANEDDDPFNALHGGLSD